MWGNRETGVCPENRRTPISLGEALSQGSLSCSREPNGALRGSTEEAGLSALAVPLCALLTIPRLELGYLARATDLLLGAPGLQL